MNACRLCTDHSGARPTIKYGLRHYAHPECMLDRWGADTFNRLRPWQVATQFPYALAKRRGFAAELEARAALAAHTNNNEG